MGSHETRMSATDVGSAQTPGVLKDDHLDWQPFQRASFPVMPRDQNTAC